ncbi:type II toxin-antitoxin system HigB family toxin [Paraburkholderia sp. SIMBA_030]|uniref:type II toxin-antitoxin system HigB family toxin n=1 Tax=Paraburkholderia sp. SIMBA_030 TaxID=3085773 RepID=UPI00397D957C
MHRPRFPHYWETGSAFCEKHPRVEQALLSWHEEATKVEWTTPQDIKARYPTASFVGKNRIVFNIKGNDYRLFVAIASELLSSISNLSASARSIRKSTPWQQGRWAGCSQESNATAAIGPNCVKTRSHRELTKPVSPQVAAFRLRQPERQITAELSQRLNKPVRASRPHRLHDRF